MHPDTVPRPEHDIVKKKSKNFQLGATLRHTSLLNLSLRQKLKLKLN
jgi:hypothetical protein